MIPIQKSLAAILLMAATSLPVFGQTQVLITFGPNNDGGKEISGYLESLQNSAEFRLNERLKLIQSMGDLADEELAKLRVAAKGAVVRFIEKEKDSKDQLLKTYRERVGIKVADKDEDEQKKKDDEKKKPVAPRVINQSFTVFIQTIFADEVEDSGLWKNTLKEVLSEEQLEIYHVELSRREAAYKNAAIDAFMAKIDMALLLTDEQKPRIREVVDDGFGNALLKNLRVSVPRGVIRGQTSSVYGSLVESILTPEQLVEWNLSIDPELQQINQGR